MKLGEWMTITEGVNSNTIPQILQYHATATKYADKSYKVDALICLFFEISLFSLASLATIV